MPIPTKPELLRILENRDVAGAAEMYAVSKSTLYRWMYRLGIPKPGREGVKNGNSKLSEEQILQIYDTRGNQPVKQVAKRFEVSVGTVCSIHNMDSHTELLIKHDLRSEVA